MKKDSRIHKTLKVDEAVEAMLDSLGIRHKYNESRVVARWEDFVGKTIANLTSEIYIRKGILFIKISSAPLKHDLFTMRKDLKNKINKEMESEIVREIIFL